MVALHSTALASAGLTLPAEYLVPRWYAVHTCPRHEKRVAEQLSGKNVEHFLPLYEAVHRWKDRRAKVQLPLFPGYIFVHIALKDRLQVLEIPSIVQIVSFRGQPSCLPQREIDALRNGLANRLRAEPYPYLKVGRRVRVRSGPLFGAEGILLRKKDTFRLVLSLELIMRSVAVEVDVADVEPLP